MANAWDASIKLLYPADEGTFFTIDVLEQTDNYVVVANVEIGEDLNEFASEHVLRVAIVNLTTASQVDLVELKQALTPQNNQQRRQELRAEFGPIKNSSSGDVLQAVASYTVIAGANTDVSTASSVTFVVGG
jgi:hypothetical protein